MTMLRAVLVAALSLTLVLAGCASKGKDDDPVGPAGSGAHTVAYTAQERVAQLYNTTGTWSQTLLPGAFAILPGEGHFVSVSLPLTEGGAALLDPLNGPQVHLGLFLPDVPAGTKVPVIADVGPYYRTSSGLRGELDPGLPVLAGEMDPPATEPANRLGKFLIDTFVPHGFAVAQVSVFGTGDSNHCFDMFGLAEQLGVDAAVTWLGEQDWSNGNVSLIGRSYDGSTPWMGAAFGNPHLKTIVPISGLTGLQDLVTRNGTSEARVATFQNVVYGGYEIDGDVADVQALCPDALLAVPFGAGALVSGDTVLPLEGTYLQERQFFPRVLANYQGSVYFIHGLQDWNVDPHIITPAFQQLRDAGLDVKGLFGQWGHMYPDRPGEHESLPEDLGAYPQSVRYDWAEDLLEWFTYYLKGDGPQPLLKVEVQDNAGGWRVEDTFPPLDSIATPLAIPGDDASVSAAGGAATYDLPALSASAATHLSGHLYLEASVTPTLANGQLYFTVSDAETGERLAFGTMDLRHRGGEGLFLIPGQAVEARLQSEPLDFVLPAGHGLQLTIEQFGGDILPSPTAGPVTFHASASRLVVPVIERPDSAFFVPPAWEGTRGDDAPAA